MKQRSRPVAFTLIELLFVIAIIAILTSLLLPALRNARKESQSSLCKNNLRHIGIGFYNYSDDYNGWIMCQTGGLVPAFGVSCWSANLIQNAYICPEILVCPSYLPYKWDPRDTNRWMKTYGRRGLYPTAYEKLHKLSNTEFIAADSYDTVFTPPTQYYYIIFSRAAHLRHNKGANTLMPDCSVQLEKNNYFVNIGFAIQY